jgi:hypothetical protein
MSAVKNFNNPGKAAGENPEMSFSERVFLELAECRAGSRKVLKIPQGTHHIYPDFLPEKLCHISNHDAGLKRILFDLEGLQDITVEGNGAELIFHGRIIPFYLKNSKNIRIRNIKIDWDRPFLSQAEVIGSGNGFLDLRFGDESPVAVQGGGLVFTGDRFYYGGIDNLLEFDPETAAPAAGARDNFGLRCWNRAEEREGGIVRLFSAYHPDNRFTAGNVVVIKNEKRWSPAFSLITCEKISLEHIDLYHAGGMGVIAQNCRDVELDHIRVMKRPGSTRVFSVFVDAFHFVDCCGRLVIQNCLMEGQMDDAVNIHGIFLRVCGFLSPGTVRLRLMHHQQFGVQTLFPGDTAEFFDDRTLRRVSSATVKKVELINNEVMDVTFDRIPAGLSGEHLLVMRADHDIDVLIKNCTLRNNRSRGVLFNTYGRCRIEHCFFHVPWQAIRISGAVDGKWYESGPVDEVEVTDCTFDRCGYSTGNAVIEIIGAVSNDEYGTPYHGNVSIHNNRFLLAHGRLMDVDHVSKLDFFSNYINGDFAAEIKSGINAGLGKIQNLNTAASESA